MENYVNGAAGFKVSRSVQHAASLVRTNIVKCQWFPSLGAALALGNDSGPFSAAPVKDATQKTIGMDFCR